MRYRIVAALVFILILGLDQWTKGLALGNLTLGEPLPVIEGLFNFTLVFNPGVAFGMYADWEPMYRYIAIGISTFLAFLAVLYFMFYEVCDDKISKIMLWCVLSGALGNTIDRFRYDYVVDFLDFYWGDYHWPAFNIADSAICVGVTVMMFRIIFVNKAEEGSSK